MVIRMCLCPRTPLSVLLTLPVVGQTRGSCVAAAVAASTPVWWYQPGEL